MAPGDLFDGNHSAVRRFKSVSRECNCVVSAEKVKKAVDQAGEKQLKMPLLTATTTHMEKLNCGTIVFILS
jgi:hypothetical protein